MLMTDLKSGLPYTEPYPGRYSVLKYHTYGSHVLDDLNVL